jgi:hypothetical protein
MRVGGEAVPVLPLAANGLQPSVTPCAGIAGPLVYVGSQRFAACDILDAQSLFARIRAQARADAPSPGRRLWALLDDALRRKIDAGTTTVTRAVVVELARSLDQTVLPSVDLYDAESWHDSALRDATRFLIRKREHGLDLHERIRLNRLLIEDAYPAEIARGVEGKALRDSIVIADWEDSEVFAEFFRLGAAALVFLGGDRNDPATAGRGGRTPVSADLPRFYVSQSEARTSALLAAERATLVASVRWEKRPARNLFLWIPGTNASFAAAAEYVILSAPYDTQGPVPYAAPGVEAAANCAALLEIAGQLARAPPRRSTLIAFFDAHANFLEGGRRFYADLRRSIPERIDDPLPLRRSRIDEERRGIEELRGFFSQPDLYAAEHPRKDKALKRLADTAKSRYNGCVGTLIDLRGKAYRLKGVAQVDGQPRIGHGQKIPAEAGTPALSSAVAGHVGAGSVGVPPSGGPHHVTGPLPAQSLAELQAQIDTVESDRRDWQTVRESIRDRKPVPASDARAVRLLNEVVAATLGALSNRVAELDGEALQLDDALKLTAPLTGATPVCHMALRFTAGGPGSAHQVLRDVARSCRRRHAGAWPRAEPIRLGMPEDLGRVGRRRNRIRGTQHAGGSRDRQRVRNSGGHRCLRP